MSAESPSSAGTTAPRADTLVGRDRACIQCGFNLVGQSVVREPAYGLLIVRCPECSTAASIQEYPALGKWARRWGALLAGAWLLALMVWSLITVIVFIGTASSTADSAAEKYATHLAGLYLDVAKAEYERLAAADPTVQGARAQQLQWVKNQEPSVWISVDRAWWDAQDPGKIFADAGGYRGMVAWSALAQWVPIGLAFAGIGAVWAVCLCHVRGWRLALIPAIVGGVALAITLVPAFGDTFGFMSPLRMLLRFSAGGQWISAATLAQERIAPLIVPVTVGFSIVAMAAGVFLGRPLARLAVRVLLPPRLRGTLAFLWLCDAKPVPATGPVYVAPGVRKSPG